MKATPKGKWQADNREREVPAHSENAAAEAISQRFQQEFTDIGHYLIDAIEKQFAWDGARGKMMNDIADRLLDKYIPLLADALAEERAKKAVWEQVRQEVMESLEVEQAREKHNAEIRLANAEYDARRQAESERARQEQADIYQRKKAIKDAEAATKVRAMEEIKAEIWGKIENAKMNDAGVRELVNEIMSKGKAE